MEEEPEKCEGCGAPATTSDSEGVPLCNECYQTCVDDPSCHVNDGDNEPARGAGAGSMQPVVRTPEGELSTEPKMIYDELHNVIRRWMSEGDELKAFEVIGALEAVKADYMDTLQRFNKRQHGAEES